MKHWVFNLQHKYIRDMQLHKVQYTCIIYITINNILYYYIHIVVLFLYIWIFVYYNIADIAQKPL